MNQLIAASGIFHHPAGEKIDRQREMAHPLSIDSQSSSTGLEVCLFAGCGFGFAAVDLRMLPVSSLSAWERDLFELQLVPVGQGLSRPVGWCVRLAEGMETLWVHLPHPIWPYTYQRLIAARAALRSHV